VRIEDTRDAELVLGRLRRIHVEGQNILVAGVIRIDRLEMEAHGVRFRGGPDRLERVDWSRLAVEIAETALNDYLTTARRKEEAHVTLEEGEVALKGVLRLLGTPVPVETRGTLVIARGSQLLYQAREVHAPTLQLPDRGIPFVERQINPLVDVSRLDWPVRLESVEVHAEKIVLVGALDLPRP
jgi:hypothetical protein